jgi:hypothetical protein
MLTNKLWDLCPEVLLKKPERNRLDDLEFFIDEKDKARGHQRKKQVPSPNCQGRAQQKRKLRCQRVLHIAARLMLHAS